MTDIAILNVAIATKKRKYSDIELKYDNHKLDKAEDDDDSDVEILSSSDFQTRYNRERIDIKVAFEGVRNDILRSKKSYLSLTT